MSKGGLYLSANEDEMYRRIAARFDSEEWYLIFSGFGSKAVFMYREIEESYYKPGTPANADFELIIAAPRFVVAMAKISRMNQEQLRKILVKYHDDPTRFQPIVDGKGHEAKTLIGIGFRDEPAQNIQTVLALKKFNTYMKDRELA